MVVSIALGCGGKIQPLYVAARPKLSRQFAGLADHQMEVKVQRQTAPTTASASLHPRLKVRPHIRAAFSARGAGEAWLDVGEPHVVRPAIGAGLDMMAAAMITAKDHHRPRAGFAHLAEGEFLLIRSSWRRLPKKSLQSLMGPESSLGHDRGHAERIALICLVFSR